MIGINDLTFIEQTIMRPGGRSRVIRAGNRVDDTGTVDPIRYDKGKLIPAYLALIAIIKNSRYKTGGGKDIQNCACEIGGIGGRTNLICYDVDSGFFPHQPDHRFYKIIAVFGVDPGGADND